jgi:hypothetical protein
MSTDCREESESSPIEIYYIRIQCTSKIVQVVLYFNSVSLFVSLRLNYNLMRFDRSFD